MKSNFISILLVGIMTSSFISVNAATLGRYGGANRFETAEIINNKMTSKTLILASAFSFADALAATPLVHYHDGEIHLAGNTLDDNTVASLKRGEFSKAIIVGGTGVINTNIELQLDKYLGGSNVTRLGGLNRYETSNKIVEHIMKLSPQVPYTFIVAGLNFADALSVAPVAAMTGAPVVLSDGKTLVSNGISAAKRTTDTVYKIGGPAIIGNNFDKFIGDYDRIYGKDRFETNQLVVSEFRKLFTGDDVFVASGFDYPDALAGSALAAQEKAPIVFTGANSHYQNAKNSVKTLNKKNLTALGGTAVVSTNVMNQLNSVTSTKPTNTPPSLIVAKPNITVELGTKISASSFSAVASDNEDGNLTSRIKIVGNYDVNKAGTYKLNLSVTDNSGVTTTQAVTLTVVAKSTEGMFTSTTDPEFVNLLNNKFLTLINAERARVGVGAMKISQPLVGLANDWSQYMVDANFFDHVDASGKGPAQVFPGYVESFAGNNIAMAWVPSSYPNITKEVMADFMAKDLYNRWKESPSHYQKMIGKWYKEIGLGMAINDKQVKATLNFR